MTGTLLWGSPTSGDSDVWRLRPEDLGLEAAAARRIIDRVDEPDDDFDYVEFSGGSVSA